MRVYKVMNSHLEMGKFNELEIVRETENGVYLDSDAGEILLPRKYVPANAVRGVKVQVFVYADSEDRPVATTLKPAAVVGEFAWLKVVAITRVGAFLDWGLPKDLLVPHGEQSGKMEVGKKYIVRIFLDDRTRRIAATTKIGRFLEKDTSALREREEVSLLVYLITDYGIKVIVNNRYLGMLYENEVFEKLHTGDRAEGFINRIRPDGKLDIMLGKPGPADLEEAKAVILKSLKEHRGFLPLGDDSEPAQIREMVHMSKKIFKRAIGNLYKNGQIEMKEDGIKLIRNKAKMIHLFKF